MARCGVSSNSTSKKKGLGSKNRQSSSRPSLKEIRKEVVQRVSDEVEGRRFEQAFDIAIAKGQKFIYTLLLEVDLNA